MNYAGPRLDASIQGMKAFYPRFSLAGSPIGTGPVAVWRGIVQPIQSGANLEALLDDLYHDRPVEILPEGRVQHNEACGATHVDHDWMEEITNPYVSYQVEVRYRGDSAHPHAYVLDPPLRSKKHTLGDGAICPYAPWEKVWSWKQHTVVDFMDHVLIWLIKSTIWSETRVVWLGEERRHDTEYLLSTIEPAAQCWCGSGAQYQNCHRTKDQGALFGRFAAILAEYDRRNPYFIEFPRGKRLRRSRKAVLSHQSNTRFKSLSNLAKDSRPNA